MDVDPLGYLGGVLTELQPGQQGLGDPVALAGAQLGQRGQAADAQRGGQVLVGQDEQGGQGVGCSRSRSVRSSFAASCAGSALTLEGQNLTDVDS